MSKDYEKYMLYGLAIVLIVALIISISNFFGFQMPSTGIHSSEIKSIEQSTKLFSKPRMTSFDLELAKKNMDKDGDGRCDFCGMPVDMCIDSGEIECGMNPDSKIGKLGSAHIHADFKAYTKGEMLNFNDEKYFVKSSFVHVEREKNSDETGNVLHFHATGVPLSMFFESINLNMESPRLFVNEKEEDFFHYAPKDEDKFLVTTSSGNLIAKEFASITNYAKNH